MTFWSHHDLCSDKKQCHLTFLALYVYLQDKAEKVEQDRNVEADVNEVHGPMKDDEIDEDDDIWNSYKSEF